VFNQQQILTWKNHRCKWHDKELETRPENLTDYLVLDKETFSLFLVYNNPSLPSYSTFLTGHAPTFSATLVNSGQISPINARIISIPFSNAPLVHVLPSLKNRFSTHVVRGSCFASSSIMKRGAVAVLPANTPASCGARKPPHTVKNAVHSA
jgi:hypothetical protein